MTRAANVPALVRALIRTGLLEAALRDGAIRVVTVARDAAGGVHSSGCALACGTERVGVTAAELLAGSPGCPSCERRLAHQALSTDLHQMLDAAQGAAAAVRAAGRPLDAAAARRAATTLRHLGDHATTLARLCARNPDLAADAERIRQAVLDAAATLREQAGGDHARDGVLEKIRSDLIGRNPRRLAQTLRAQDPAHLIGIYPAWSATPAVAAALTALAQPGARHQVLVGPRWVADWLHREMYRSGNFPYIQCVDVSQLGADVVAVACQLWDPGTAGPLVDLAVAVTTAANLGT